MVSFNPDKGMEVPFDGSIQSHGAITITSEEWESLDSINTSTLDKSIFPLSAILREGHVVNIYLHNVNDNQILEILQENNPFFIEEISVSKNKQKIIKAKSKNGHTFIQRIYQGSVSTADLEIKSESIKITHNITNFDNSQITYYILPDIVLIEKLDISEDITSQII